VGPIRRELAMPTIMNVLGPVTNPAGARRQVVGVSDPALLELIAGALRELGHERAMVLHGEPGMDEISPLGPTRIIELRDGELAETSFDPARELGWAPFDVADLSGGEREENARKVVDVLRGRVGGGARAATLLNAGAAIYLAGLADTLVDGVARAETALDAGAGWQTLNALREATGTT
jgi:anthranilate phosphoribosyltransferase